MDYRLQDRTIQYGRDRLMARTFLATGMAGTGKTTFALADASPENPVAYKGMEPGGFDRAATRLRLSEGSVVNDYYPAPENELETLLAGIPTLGGKGGLKADFHYQLDGWSEILNRLVTGMMASSRAGQRPVFDTATRFWLIVRNAYEEMVQKATGAEAESIGQLRYTWPNKVHMQVHEFPIKYGLDVVWISHETQVWNTDPPQYKPDCWKELEGMVDVSLKFFIRDRKPIARITKGAEVGMTVKDLEVEEPTLKKLNALLDVVAILEAEDEEVERDAEALLIQAKIRGLYA